MPTKREREYYAMGFRDAMQILRERQTGTAEGPAHFLALREMEEDYQVMLGEADSPREVRRVQRAYKPKRKLSAWNKYVKNKRNHITYRDGKLNLKKMAVAFRRKKRR